MQCSNNSANVGELYFCTGLQLLIMTSIMVLFRSINSTEWMEDLILPLSISSIFL